MKKRSEATQTLRAGCSKADPQTNTQTDRGDYNALRSLARSVKMKIQLHPSEGGYVFTRVRSFVCLFVRITLKLLTRYHKNRRKGRAWAKAENGASSDHVTLRLSVMLILVLVLNTP